MGQRPDYSPLPAWDGLVLPFVGGLVPVFRGWQSIGHLTIPIQFLAAYITDGVFGKRFHICQTTGLQHDHTTVHMQGGTSQICCFRACKVQHCRRNLVRLTHATGWNLC